MLICDVPEVYVLGCSIAVSLRAFEFNGVLPDLDLNLFDFFFRLAHLGVGFGLGFRIGGG